MATHPSDTDLFEAFVALRFDAFALARQRGLPILTILDWFESAPVQEALARLDRMTDRALALCARLARFTALNALGDAANATEDPVELRRASATLSSHTRPSRTQATPAPTSPEHDNGHEAHAPHPSGDDLTLDPDAPIEPESYLDRGRQSGPASLLHASAGLAAPSHAAFDHTYADTA